MSFGKRRLPLAVLVAGFAIHFTLASGPAQPREPGWRVNPYPNQRRFAFTLVSDADSSWSRRLAPLFDEFDTLGMKITTTVFTHWADWAADGRIWATWLRAADDRSRLLAPRAVPLIDPSERRFYLALAARGHEIGMHSATDTSDTTQKLEAAFALFTSVFGHPPTVYTEHSAKSNKEALGNEGANPRSPYFSLAVLRRYNPWVWVDGEYGMPPPGADGWFDLAAFSGAPLSNEAAAHYGLAKVFARTGKWKNANGDGFLEWYSEDTIRTLSHNRGVALVYTHLNEKWLDAASGKMRVDLRARLRWLTLAEDGWFVPAGTILDRLHAIRDVILSQQASTIRVTNRGSATVWSVSLISPDGRGLCRNGRSFQPGKTGSVPVGDIRAGETLRFDICRPGTP